MKRRNKVKQPKKREATEFSGDYMNGIDNDMSRFD